MTKRATAFTVLSFGLWTGVGLQAQNLNLTTSTVASQVLTIPQKGSVAGTTNGEVELVLRLYTTQTGGTPDFTERQAVTVQNGTYLTFIGSATPGGIPASVYNSVGTFWVAAGSAATLNDNLPRTPFTLRRDSSTPGTDAITLSFAVDPSVCYTCGGAWPIFAGMITSAGHATERPAACGGALTYAADSSPYICSR